MLRMFGYRRARMFWLKRILYDDRNLLCHRRLNRWRIDHLSPEITQLHSFLVTHLRNCDRITHQSWVSGHHSIDICPYLKCFRIECACENGGCII